MIEAVPRSSDYPADLRLRVGVEFRHQLERPTPAVLQVEPRRDGSHRILEEELVLPSGIANREYLDMYGNVCRRLVMPAGVSTIRYLGLIQVSSDLDPAAPDAQQLDVDDLPHDALIYTMPSRLIESDLLSNTAWRLFGNTAPGWRRVQAIVDWVHDNIEFAHGSSTSITSASQVYLESRGVCRDLAQLSVAFCRALNIPARYVFGYLPDVGVDDPFNLPMDFYAWFEVYLGDRWWTFDPRNNERRRCRVTIGRGRDAVDVAMITTFGSAPLTGFRVWAETMEASDRLDNVEESLP
ncbi:MAG TPA: transglutaminase family protein [Candidatus Dormibacteraeota bacterium]